MSHLKRQSVPKNWPVPRKGTAYVVKPLSNLENGIPLLIALRDILGICQNRKEVKKALAEGNVLINQKKIKEDRIGLQLFDVMTLIPSKKSYRVTLTEKGKFTLKEIKENEAGKKIAKVIDKKVLRGKKVQLNLSDGRNFLSEIKCNTNDSVIIEFEKKKVGKFLALKETAKVLVFAGKHAGSEGIIQNINKERKTAEIKVNSHKVNALIKQIMVVE